MTDLSRLGDAELVRRFCVGLDREAAFTVLVHRHGGMVTACCRRALGGNHADAEDAAQQTFVLLARELPRLRQPEAVAAWLQRTACGVCSHHRRSEERRRERERRAMQDLQRTTVDASLDHGELLQHLEQAIADLRLTQRSVVVRHCLEGRSQAAVADELGITVDAVKQRLRSALRQLERRLRRQGAVLPAVGLLGLLDSLPAAEAPDWSTGAILRRASLEQAVGGPAAGGVSVWVMACAALLVGGLVGTVWSGWWSISPMAPSSSGASAPTPIFFPEYAAAYRQRGFTIDPASQMAGSGEGEPMDELLMSEAVLATPDGDGSSRRLTASGDSLGVLALPLTQTSPPDRLQIDLRFRLESSDPAGETRLSGPFLLGMTDLAEDVSDLRAKPFRDLQVAVGTADQQVRVVLQRVGRLADGRPVYETCFTRGGVIGRRDWQVGRPTALQWHLQGTVVIDEMSLDRSP